MTSSWCWGEVIHIDLVVKVVLIVHDTCGTPSSGRDDSTAGIILGCHGSYCSTDDGHHDTGSDDL